MVVIKISYPHGPRPFDSSSSSPSSPSGSPILRDSSGSTEPLNYLFQVSADGDTLAATKQEEWVTKKRTELTTTKQIETRVKRQVVLEDGKVVDDSGPLVTTTTTEDTDKKESQHTEHLTQGDDPHPEEGWVAIEGIPEEAVVKETNERKVITHDEVEDIYETEEVHHLGNMTNNSLVRAIQNGEDHKISKINKDSRDLIPVSQIGRNSSNKRVVQQSKRHDRTTDIHDTNEISRVKENGNVVTEIKKRHEHEEFHNEDIPDSDSDEFEHIERREGNEEFRRAKNEELVEYYALPRGGALNQGVKVGESGHFVSENISSQRQGDEDLWDSVSERIRRLQRGETPGGVKSPGGPPLSSSRSDALTNRPLDFDQEEHTRKNETNRWLNSHFGSSSSSLNSEPSPRSPLRPTPQGIHVTMTSRSSPVGSPPPPPPPPPMPSHPHHSPHKGDAKRISFRDEPKRRPTLEKDHRHEMKSRSGDVLRSVNSSLGRTSMPKCGDEWEEESTPTPPPRSRRRNSPDLHHILPIAQPGNMPRQTQRFASELPSYLQKTGDYGERKGYERREQSFGYTGPPTHRGVNSLESGTYGNSGYVSKHTNYYKTNETNNPGQNESYENGDAEVTERKTVERREKTFSYDGPPQKQFHPKYIVGTPESTMHRLKGVEHIDESDGRSNTMPRKRFYFGDDDGTLPNRPERRNTIGRGNHQVSSNDFNVSISNSYKNANDSRKSSSLNRSLSFTPRTITKPSVASNLLSSHKYEETYKSNPHIADGPSDLMSPRLINLMSRSVRDVNSIGNYSNYGGRYGHGPPITEHYSTTSTDNYTTRKVVMENLRNSEARGASPARSMTPTYGQSRSLMSKQFNSRAFGGANSPASDDYNETYRMSSSTPDHHEENKPRITTDTTSKFSRRTLQGSDGQPSGKVESSETTTRTKSRFKESEVMYPNGKRASPSRNHFHPQLTSEGTVIIPVRDTNNNRNKNYM